MKSIINVTPKKRGRPATGKQPHVSVRMEPELIKALDNYLRDNPNLHSRSDAIRLILSKHLNR
jgi:metal-responsive CopG/Arc/MetJ family transcriptional regulator